MNRSLDATASDPVNPRLASCDPSVHNLSSCFTTSSVTSAVLISRSAELCSFVFSSICVWSSWSAVTSLSTSALASTTGCCSLPVAAVTSFVSANKFADSPMKI